MVDRRVGSLWTPSEGLAGSTLDQQQREHKATLHRVATACSEVIDSTAEPPLYAYRSVWHTDIRDLGEYGVGVVLYFDYLKFLGAVLLVLSILSMPSLIMNSIGSLIIQQTPLKSSLGFFKMIAGSSLGNLGELPNSDGTVEWLTTNGIRDIDKTFEKRSVVGDGSEVSNATGTLGTIDGICVLIFILAGMWFKLRFIPRVVQEQDDDNDTPADYTVTVVGLPRRLPNKHAEYKQLLREHFVNVLDDAGFPMPESLVAEVVLCRDYDNHLLTYMELGHLLFFHIDCIAKMNNSLMHGDDERAEEHVLEAHDCKDHLLTKAEILESAHLSDEDRDVMVAYVSFHNAVSKLAVMEQYQKSVPWLPQRFQPEKLSFFGNPIVVKQAPEPSLIFFENLDYPRKHRNIRHCVILVVAMVVLLLTLSVGSMFRKVPVSEKHFTGAPVWVVRLAESNGKDPNSNKCFSMCSWEFKYHHSEDGCVKHSGAYPASSGDLKFFNANRTLGAFDGSSPCPLHCGSSIEPWVAVDFREKLKFCDMKLHSEAEHAFAITEIYGCMREDLPPAWDSFQGQLSAFDPRHACTKMGEARLKDSSTLFEEDAVVEIKEDRNCEDSYYEDLDLEVLTRIRSDVSDYRIACYCTRMQNKGVIPNECVEWEEEISAKKRSYYAGLVIAVLLTQMNWVILTQLARYAKYDCLSDLAIMKTTLVFGAQFTNVGLAAVVASMNSHGFYGRLGFGFFDTMADDRAFYDYTVDWFVLVGSTVIIKLMGNMFGYVCQIPFKSLIVNSLYVSFFKARVVTVDALKRLYILPEFPFPSRVAATNVVICSLMMFSGGLPLLYLVGCLYCLMAYWSDKWALLKGSCRPPAYDAAVFDLSVSIFPLTGALHILMSLSMYNHLLFPCDFGIFQGLFEGLVNMDAEEQKVIFRMWNSGMGETWKLDLDEYMRARILDVSRKCSTFLFMILFVMLSYWFVKLVRFTVRSIRLLWILSSDNVEDKKLDCCRRIDLEELLPFRISAEVRPSMTLTNYQQARAKSETRNQSFSYDFRKRKKYKAAKWGLSYASNELTEESFEEWAKSINYKSGKRLSQLLGFQSKPAGGENGSASQSLSAKWNDKEPQQTGRLWVTIVSASNLSNKDMFGKSDPFSRCGVVNKPEMVFQTNVIDDTLDPNWDWPEQHLPAWEEGDTLRFTVWDQDQFGKELLGRAMLASDELNSKLVDGVFDGELPLGESGSNGSTLRVRIRKTPFKIDTSLGHVSAAEEHLMDKMYENIQGIGTRTDHQDRDLDSSGSSTKIEPEKSLPATPEMRGKSEDIAKDGKKNDDCMTA